MKTDHGPHSFTLQQSSTWGRSVTNCCSAREWFVPHARKTAKACFRASWQRGKDSMHCRNGCCSTWKTWVSGNPIPGVKVIVARQGRGEYCLWSLHYDTELWTILYNELWIINLSLSRSFIFCMSVLTFSDVFQMVTLKHDPVWTIVGWVESDWTVASYCLLSKR